MEKLYFEKTAELKKHLKELEEKLEVKLSLINKHLFIEGDSFHKYEAYVILEALQFGFSAQTSLTLLQENRSFKKIPIKSFTRRKKLSDVRARIIGTKGKTKNTLEKISGCKLIINENNIGIIGPSVQVESVTSALASLIRGAKHSNVYYFLEQMNTQRKKTIDDLGLKINKK